MSESATEFAEPAEPTQENQPANDQPSEEPDTGEQEQQSKDWEAEVAKWKAMSRRHEATAKANAEAAKKFAEYEESQKSEQQKIADRLAAAERRAIDAEIGRAKLMAAAAYNIPTSLLDRLGGTSEEEINEAAQELSRELEAELERRLAAMPPPPVPQVDEAQEDYSYPVRQRPVESLHPGALPAGHEPEDGNDFLRRLAGRRT